ncbi:MAG: hypothetical protein A2Y17_07650 [Clostridiales bacterium GWF2_38_85]|nr:MAG: hypothetical protein A2Y17_07650 [Clostridiales bacterium GWF2_38_85]HBL84251.1 hypothetical protein [Clostridiales bacterium]
MTTKKLFCFCLSFLLILALSNYLPIHGEEQIYTSVIRLHILANSDSEYDQQMKLAVRDKLIESAPDFFDIEGNVSDAGDEITENADKLLTFVNEQLKLLNAPYQASIKFGTEAYPTREYDGITYPAGEYKSLRILLGNGDGKNWWCVLFPPICTNAAKARDSLDISTEAKKTFTNTETKYIFRFKILEIFKRKK